MVMKFAKKKAQRTQGQNSPRYAAPLIPLVCEETSTVLKKGEYADFKVLSDPNDKDSPEYVLSVPYFKRGTP